MNIINKTIKTGFLFLIIIVCTFIPKVNAYDLVELDDYGLYCGYNDSSDNFYYFKIVVDYDSKIWESEHNFDELGISIEYGRPTDAMTMKDQASIDWFVQKGILTIPSGEKSYNWTCPSEPFGGKNLILVEKGCHDRNCSTDIIPSYTELNPSYTCDYASSTSNNHIKIDYSYSDEMGHTWVVQYPDNTTKTYHNTEINGNFMPDSSCEDIYYTKKDNRINVAVSSNEEVNENVTLSSLCNKYEESEIEHFCSGTCSYAEKRCPGSYESTSENGCPSELKPIIKFLKIVAFKTVQLFVPILLIVMGTIDFAKAVASFDDKGNKDAISKFIRRCIAAIAVFFIVTIVSIVINMFAKTDIGGKNDWKTCWQNIEKE